MKHSLRAFRGAFAHCLDAGGHLRPKVEYFDDGLMIIENGKILKLGNFSEIHKGYENISIVHYPDKLILPGLIDTHTHYPQTEIMGCGGNQLLEWLSQYTFPTEQKFENKEYARQIAKVFLDELIRNGSTTALVFCTIHSESVDALFEEAEKRKLRLIAGKVLMDRKEVVPDFLYEPSDVGIRKSEALIEKWHNHGRLAYALTPRFALTSTEEQLRATGKLREKIPGVYVQTHLSENKHEISNVLKLHTSSKNYLSVYEQSGLVGSRSIFAHSIHLDENEFEVLANTHSGISFCPTSNLFLGSGLFNVPKAFSYSPNLKISIGTDIGAGTSFSLFQTLNEAYKVAQLQGQTLSSFQLLYLATLGGSRTLDLDKEIGNFLPGKEADFIVVDLEATPIQKLKIRSMREQSPLKSLEERLFSLITLGDDRSIVATYILGELAYPSSS